MAWIIHRQTDLGRTTQERGASSLSSAVLFLIFSQFRTFEIPEDSPLRRARSAFWAIRANDEGVAHPKSFHSLAVAGKIKIVAPARVDGFTSDGKGVKLNNGQVLPADVVVVATGYQSSWDGLFDGRYFCHFLCVDILNVTYRKNRRRDRNQQVALHPRMAEGRMELLHPFRPTQEPS
jgi:hypothetical protein